MMQDNVAKKEAERKESEGEEKRRLPFSLSRTIIPKLNQKLTEWSTVVYK